MRIPKPVLGGFLIVALVAAGVYLVFFDNSRAAPGASGETSSAAEPGQSAAPPPDQKADAAPLPVKVAPVTKGDLVMTLKSPGEAYTEKQVVLKAEVGGVVKNLSAAEGRHVKQGDLLVALDDREFQLNLEKLEAQRLRFLSEIYLEKQFATSTQAPSPEAVARLDKAKADYDKASADFKKGLISQTALEKAQNDHEMALIEAGRKKDEIMASTKNLTQTEIDVKIARMNLEKTRVRAPFAGILTEIKVSPNERLDPGRELFTLVDISRIKVRAKVLESEVGKMRAGREATLRFSAYPGKAFTGRIESVSPVINAEDKTCAVYITMDNPSEEIKPGMHAEAEIPTEIFTGRLLVPQEAVLIRGGRKLVFAVEGDVAKWRYIEVGLENERFAEVLPSTEPGWGVSEGEKVIVEGHVTLAHDTKVSIVE